MIVATAGHIDHGKTTLVKALTGVDTDRLPQEKARGISIDLGFAYWKLPEGPTVGFVDVPGHERFVRNMLAGVCAIDMALLIIAADDGVMPQTREHLNILDLLEVRKGLVVITKADRVDAARLHQVHADASELLAGTSLAGAPVLAVSSMTGAGLPELRQALTQAALAIRRTSQSGQRLRYTVDRVFTVTGSGTVVTGTVVAGAVKLGDRLLVSPSGTAVRVRAIQKDGSACEQAQAGERCALNLAGIERAQVERGDWVVDAAAHAPTRLVDVQLNVLASEAYALKHWTPVHLHLGTSNMTARVALRRGAPIEPGAKSYARLLTDRPLVALHGDRFILRDQSAQRTLGGGVVVDAFPAARRLPAEMRQRQLDALSQASAAQALAALAACTSGAIDAASIARNFNLDENALAQAITQAGLVTLGAAGRLRIVTPQQAAAEEAKRKPVAEPENPEHLRLWQLAQPLLLQAGRKGLTLTQLTEAMHAKLLVLQDMLHRRAKAGDALRVGETRFYLRGTIDEFIVVAQEVARSKPEGRFTAAHFRDAAGVGRGLAIEVLEVLDRLGVTQRIADERILRPRPLTGPANTAEQTRPHD
jgi:selenocysteine-specific elongation factor